MGSQVGVALHWLFSWSNPVFAFIQFVIRDYWTSVQGKYSYQESAWSLVKSPHYREELIYLISVILRWSHGAVIFWFYFRVENENERGWDQNVFLLPHLNTELDTCKGALIQSVTVKLRNTVVDLFTSNIRFTLPWCFVEFWWIEGCWVTEKESYNCVKSLFSLVASLGLTWHHVQYFIIAVTGKAVIINITVVDILFL